jgi:DNA-binding HxlR family transcriptional regulator
MLPNMPRRSKALAGAASDACAIARGLGVLSDPWTFLLLRDAGFGRRTFAEFHESLGIATDVLTARLNTLVEAGVFARLPYQEPGQRTRHAYELTRAGQELALVLVALQQWGDEHLPIGVPLRAVPVTKGGRRPVRATFVDDQGTVVAPVDVEFVSTANVAASN